MNKIDIDKVAKKYNSIKEIWNEDDKWHLITKQNISKFIHSSFNSLINSQNFKILNAGSAGYSYGLNESNILHVDIADKHISQLSNSVVANIENLPLPENEFDLIICVGSVLNYCEPIKVINQFSKVLKQEGHIILEFESSRTFELIFKKGFNKSAVFVETFFDANDGKERLWYFSENYINQLLKKNNYKALRRSTFHILSPLIYRLTKDVTFSASFSNLDRFCKYIPVINRFCSNSIYLFKRLKH